MQIGIDARLMYHQPAGISRYTRHLIRAISRIDRTDDFVVFQHRRHLEPVMQTANFRRATLYSPVHSWLEQVMLPVELARFRLDLLHSTDFIPPLRASIPTVITVHDLAFLHWPHFLTQDSASYYGQIDRGVRRASHIIVPSESTKADLIGQLGVRDEKVTVIYEAADEKFVPLPMEPTRREIRDKYDLPHTYVLFVGTIEPRKNVDGLLRAFRRLLDRNGVSEVGLVIAGGWGWLHEEVVDLVKTLELEAKVFLLGRVSDSDLHKLYVGARCHVHPAHYEGFGLPPLEAMACGTPTVVSNISSLPEVVGDAALLINPQDAEELAVALQRLLTDDALHAELREKGLQRAKCFSWEQAALSTLDVYRRVIAKPAPASTSAAHASTRSANGP
jgi:glycosyltransferase involved in cell wall biosynthesis